MQSPFSTPSDSDAPAPVPASAVAPDLAPSLDTEPPTVPSSQSSAPAFVDIDEAERFQEPRFEDPRFEDAPHSPFVAAAAMPAPISTDAARPDAAWKLGEPDAVAAPRPSALAPLTAMLLGGAISCALVGAGFLLGARGHGGVIDPVEQIGGTYGAANADSGNAIVQAVRKIGPSVMNVDTTFGGSPSSENGSGSRENPADPDEDGPREGKGTGFVIDSARGLMLTNAHVVAGAAKIQVTSREGKVYSGRLVGADPANDVALVELSNRKLPQAHLANFSDTKQLHIGEWAIAIGNPYAQANTVTVGVISAVGRRVGPAPMPGKPGQFVTLNDMIQTDAAINPGNSGGPLCNIHGEVIGINTAILPVGQGLGFTIPINKARAVAETLLRNGGKVPFIGVLMLGVNAKVKKAYALKESKGIYVDQVIEGSPAEQAGLRSGDVIVKVSGQAVTDGEQMQKAVRSRKIGDTLQIEISRSGKKLTRTMKIAAQSG